MNLLERITAPKTAQRFTFDDWVGSLGFDGHQYVIQQTLGGMAEEPIANSFVAYTQEAHKRSGIVFACVAARRMAFSQARFLFRRFSEGRPSDLFGNPSLGLLERPWPNGTTAELLGRMEQDASLAGNFYGTVVTDQQGTRIRRLRPDFVTIVSGSRSGDSDALDAVPVGYIYKPPNGDPVTLLPDEVVHWSPEPDPVANWRGMSWLTPVLREIEGDRYATEHKRRFFVNGATPNAAVVMDKEVSKEAFEFFKDSFEKQHRGVANAYKTIFLGGGADVKVIGTDLKQLDFKAVQGAGETRIAAAARCHPIILHISEGMQGSSLNAGNYGQARRQFADLFARPQWQSAAAALEGFAPPPDRQSQLWYDDRDVPFLREDAKDEAEIQSMQASTIRQLVDAGFDAETVVDAVTSGDLRRLSLAHSGLFSVQLQPAMNGNKE